METPHEPLHLDKRSFVKWKIMGIRTIVIWIIIFFEGTFEYGSDGIFKLLRRMRKLYQSTWDHEMFYADRSSKNEQLLNTLFLALRKGSKNVTDVSLWINGV
jgi:hypothetical protein